MFGLWILVAKYFRQFGENVAFLFSHLKKICAYGEKNKDNANPDLQLGNRNRMHFFKAVQAMESWWMHSFSCLPSLFHGTLIT